MGRWSARLSGASTRLAPPPRLGAILQARRRVHLPDERVIHLVRGQRPGGQVQGRRPLPGGRRNGLRTAERDQAQGRLPVRVEAEQAVDRGVREPHHRPGRDAPGRSRGHAVGQHGAAVPEAVAVGARAVLPAIAPESRCQHQDGRRMGHGRLAAGRLHQRAPVVPRPQGSQGEPVGGEVIDARIEVGQRTGHRVEVDVVQRARARSRPKEHLAAEIAPPPGDAGAEEQQLPQLLPGDLPEAFRSGLGDGSQRGRVRRPQVLLQGQRTRGLVHLEGVGLVGPVQGVRTAADARRGVLGLLVVVLRGFGVSVSHKASPVCARSAPTPYTATCQRCLTSVPRP